MSDETSIFADADRPRDAASRKISSQNIALHAECITRQRASVDSTLLYTDRQLFEHLHGEAQTSLGRFVLHIIQASLQQIHNKSNRWSLSLSV